ANEQLITNLNNYGGEGALAGVSDLYHLTVTADAEPLIEGEYTGPLYTGQVRPTLRIYGCTFCNRQIAVGGEAGGQFATIEDLKAGGCPGCGAHSFQLISRRHVGGNGSEAPG